MNLSLGVPVKEVFWKPASRW